jgi:hypothetical protein
MNARGVQKGLLLKVLQLSKPVGSETTVRVRTRAFLTALNIIPHAAQAVRPGRLGPYGYSAVVDSARVSARFFMAVPRPGREVNGRSNFEDLEDQ